MKHAQYLLPIILATLTLVGCNSDKRKIEQVAYGYVMATGNFHIDEAEPYATRETRESTLSLARDLMPYTDSNFLKTAVPATATIDSVALYNDSTALAFYTKTNPLGTSSDTLIVIKEDGKWLVHMPLAN